MPATPPSRTGPAVGAPHRRADGRYRGCAHPRASQGHGCRERPCYRRDRARDPPLRARICSARLPENGFIPTYAAFNLLGDPDVAGREMLMALTGLNARGYKNSTLLFNLARIFIAHSPARAR